MGENNTYCGCDCCSTARFYYVPSRQYGRSYFQTRHDFRNRSYYVQTPRTRREIAAAWWRHLSQIGPKAADTAQRPGEMPGSHEQPAKYAPILGYG